jgi:hypothetical protein
MDKLLADKKVDAAAVTEYKRVQVMAGDMTREQLSEAFTKYKIKSPETGNDLEEPFQFNLMFKTPIGPSSNVPGYLRPETAQGIFVNFKRLLEYNGGKLPFAAAQIGRRGERKERRKGRQMEGNSDVSFCQNNKNIISFGLRFLLNFPECHLKQLLYNLHSRFPNR